MCICKLARTHAQRYGPTLFKNFEAPLHTFIKGRMSKDICVKLLEIILTEIDATSS
jgi:hypothetical protein